MDVLTLSSLPIGYRFRPTDKELVNYYLRNKINGNEKDVQVICEIDVCKQEPWDLPEFSVVKSEDLEWYFFCPRDQKYPSGLRSNRATKAGYWKSTGNDRKIKNRRDVIGMKKTLVFYKGRAPKGKRSNWVMHEYRPTLAELDGTHPGQNAFVLCRLFKKLDESVENSHCDEVEPALSSPTATNSSPEITQSELPLDQENSVLESQVEKQPTNSESFQAEDFESSSVVPIECHNHSGIADDHTAAVTLTEVNPPQVEYGVRMSDPTLSGCQMWAELKSFDMHHPFPIDFSNGHSELQFQYDTNEQGFYISEFLNSEDDTNKTVNEDSVVKDSVVKDNSSCSESDRIVIYQQGGGKVSSPTSELLNSIFDDDYFFGDLGTQNILDAEIETLKFINTKSQYQDFVKDIRLSGGLDPGVVHAQGEEEVNFDISELLNSICYETEDDYFCGDLGIQNNLAADNETSKYIDTTSHYPDSVKLSRSSSELDDGVLRAEGNDSEVDCFSEYLGTWNILDAGKAQQQQTNLATPNNTRNQQPLS